ncbi:telomere length regulation protein TEL2 homolog [Aplysia californica]|uniref:Telomere length regulation protein TEL2 homolog n=1 Tax=Aplysia californica TaxID=6500 RepID=A0ABM0KAY1_APLCA|nr:telomere length regulation protein TEL2 homolog [Aplysia californica]
MESKCRKLIKDVKTRFDSAETKEEILKWSSIIRSLLSVHASCSENKLLDALEYDEHELFELRKTISSSPFFAQQLYGLFIQKFSVDWMSSITTENFHKIVKAAFLDGPVSDAFLCLSQAITESSTKDFRFHTCVSLLEGMVNPERLAEVLLTHCRTRTTGNVNSAGFAFDVHESEMLVSALASLPERMANRLRHDNSESFYPSHYTPVLSMAVLRVLDDGHAALTGGRDVSLQVVSALVGKLCLTGAGDLFLDTILPHLCANVRKNFAWSRICVRVFVGVPSRCLEAVLVLLLQKIPWYGLVDKFLGDCVVENSTARMLVCTKLLLFKNFSQPKLLLQNIIGYLCHSDTRRHLYLEVIVKLLEVWGSTTSMRHISSEQHRYISRALVVCLGALRDQDIAAKKDELLRLLMPGVQAHLESSDPTVRLLGMAVAKRLTNTLDPSGPQLEFELDMNNEMVKDLLSYEGLPADPGPTQAEMLASEQQDELAKNNVLEKKMADVKLQDSANGQAEVDSDLDSDDDLVPYDMSNDLKVKTVKPPKYLRECMEGLLCITDNLDKAELCLKHAEAIVRKKRDGLDEIAAEFAKILLHMSDSHGIEDFYMLRRKTLVALAVTSPKEVADYMTSQFYEWNYNLRQRMDVLEVLAEAAGELSHPEKVKRTEKDKLIQEVTPSSEPASWREVVQKRIESNTRRFAKGRTRPEPTAQLNRFAPVAGHFFYPLLVKVDKREPCLDLLGQDSALLFRLLYTLAIVVHAASNLPSVTQMGRTLLEFTWSLRMHQDQSVRHAVLIATTTVFLSVPAHDIMTELHADISETMTWLEDVIEKDADTDCQKMAAQALLILQEQMKKEVESQSS